MPYPTTEKVHQSYSCNFGVLFPWWDMAFGTAVFEKRAFPTGVRNLEVSNNVLVQQWQGLRHSWQQLFVSKERSQNNSKVTSS